MKTLISFEPYGEPTVRYSVDPAYVCALREDPAHPHNSYIYINTLQSGIAVTLDELLRFKRKLAELNHPTLPIQTDEAQNETQAPQIQTEIQTNPNPIYGDFT